MTNNHVVDGAKTVQVTTDDGRTLDAKVIGADSKTDVALLKVTEGGNFPFVKLAKGSPRVGDWVVAIGNPFGLGGTVTSGIVSARGRDIGAGPYDDFLQIDAPINKGNSGGPTFNLQGEVVGMNTAIYSPSGGSVGLAFAVPASTVQTVVDQLQQDGRVSRGYLGVQIQPLTKELAEGFGLSTEKGALVAGAQDGTPAEKAGLKSGDVITAVDGEPVANARELTRKIGALKPGAKAEITYLRDGKERTATVALASQPGEKEAKAAPSQQRRRPAEARPRACALARGRRRRRRRGRSGRAGGPEGRQGGRRHPRGRRPGGVEAGRRQGRARGGAQGRQDRGAAARQEQGRHPLRRHRDAEGGLSAKSPLAKSPLPAMRGEGFAARPRSKPEGRG